VLRSIGSGDEARPPLLEAGPRHHRVLHAEQGDEQRVDHDCRGERPVARPVDRRQHAEREVADERRHPAVHAEEQGVTCHAVEEEEFSLHRCVLLVRVEE
jgi:hypothetical protein